MYKGLIIQPFIYIKMSALKIFQKIQQKQSLLYIPILIICSLIFFRLNTFEHNSLNAFPMLIAILIIFIQFGIDYLSGVSNDHYSNLAKHRELHSEFLALKHSVELSNVSNKKEYFDSIKAELAPELIASLSSFSTKDALLNKFIANKIKSLERINSYKLLLNRKANFNLLFGLTFSISGIFFIFYSLNDFDKTRIDFYSTILYFLPRILLTVLIEIFAYFFLSLYKSNLQEIKYFENEMTNLEVKFIALEYAHFLDDNQLKVSLIEQLMNTERNFILKKDETTIELEKNRIDAQSSNSTVQALKDIINFKR